MMPGGHKVDVRGVVPDYKYRRNIPESEFLISQAEYSQSCERLGSCLVMEYLMIKSSMLFDVFEHRHLPSYNHLAPT